MNVMKVLFQNDIIPELPLCTATIGFFDGVHAGHRFLIDELKKEAGKRQHKSMVVTFAVHPQKILRHDAAIEILTTLPEKLTLLEAAAIDYCVVLEFTKEVAQLSAQQFLQEILSARYSVAALLIGHDHRFGHNRTAGFEQYAEYGRTVGIDVVQAAQYTTGDKVKVSSSRIRQLLKEGDLTQANKLLARSYSFSGTVTNGQKLGRQLGFPTANLQPNDSAKLLPASGVYAVRCVFADKKHNGMMNIGFRPTINANSLSIEAHLFDFNQTIYGQTVEVEMLAKIRNEKKFESLDTLKKQLEEDKRQCETFLSSF